MKTLKETIIDWDTQYDFVNPSHYELWEGFEGYDLIKKVLTREELIGYLKGNILKYQVRQGKKPGEDLERENKKIEWYRERLDTILRAKFKELEEVEF